MKVQKNVCQRALAEVSLRTRGPGGAVAMLQDGQLRATRIWGFADTCHRIPMTTDTIMPICSITKQFICALLIDLQRNPVSSMKGLGASDIEELITREANGLLPPSMRDSPALTIDEFCNNQSGICDYWALTTLWGARPEDEFSLASHGSAMRKRLTFHFTPGTEFSYSNTNFHLLARAIEIATGEPINSLLRERIFVPAGMASATFCPDTARLAEHCIGYEGNEANGYIPATNRVEWSGDAGILASLSDMIAYEKYLDRIQSDPEQWYSILTSKPSQYRDGAPASYRYGLEEIDLGGFKALGHGGALRGFRHERLYSTSERLSVVVMLNHEACASDVARSIVSDIYAPNVTNAPTAIIDPSPSWFGTFLDADTKLAVTISKGHAANELLVAYVGSSEVINLVGTHRGESYQMHAVVHEDGVTIRRLEDHRIVSASKIKVHDAVDISLFGGKFHCPEIDSLFQCFDLGGLLYGTFDGFLGKGPARLMRQLGPDVWAIACPRGMDAPAPGDWTIVFNRSLSGHIEGATIGCWLARGLKYTKLA